MNSRKIVEMFKKKWIFFTGVLIIAAGLFICFSYINIINKPMKSFDISPSSAEGWSYTLQDGTPVEPDSFGTFNIPQDEILYCSFTFTDGEMIPDAISDHTSKISASASLCDCVFFINGNISASPSGRYAEGSGFSSADTAPHSWLGQFTFSIHPGDTLSMAVQFLTDDTSLFALPDITFYGEVQAFNSASISPAVRSAMPAGMFLATALFLSALFLYQLWNGKKKWQLILLSLCAFAFCLENTVSYSYSAISFLQEPIIIWLLNFIPALPVLWSLWYHTTGKLRRFSSIIPAACTTAVIIAAAIGLSSGGALTSPYPTLLSTKLIPAASLAVIICGLTEIRRGCIWYKRFFTICAFTAAAYIAAAFIMFAFGADGLMNSFSQAFFMIEQFTSFLSLLKIADNILFISLFAAEVYDFIRDTADQNTQLRLLTLQNRYALENTRILKTSIQSVREMRHEQMHHMEALSALCEAGDFERVKSYVNDMRHISRIDNPILYTDNALVNALITPRLKQASEAGARTHISVQIPEILPVKDTDLSIFLTNLLDNAVEGLRGCGQSSDKCLTFKMGILQNRLFISCENTYSGKLLYNDGDSLASTKSEDGHGFGISIMQNIAQEYNSILIVESDENIFRVKTSLALPPG